MSIWLEKIHINNYRSCKHSVITLNEKLSALIGVNGSGKSNFLNGITLINKVLRSSRRYFSEEYLQSVCKIKCTFNLSGKRIYYDVLIHHTTTDKNVDEVTHTTEKWNFKDFTKKDRWISFPLEAFSDSTQLSLFPDAGEGTEIEFARRMRRYRVDFESLDKIDFGKIAPLMEQVTQFIGGMTYYSASQFTDPSKSPTYFEIESEGGVTRKDALYRRSRPFRGEHIQFMQDLYLTFENNKAKFQEFMSIIGKHGIGLIDDIKYKRVTAPSRDIKVYTGGKFVKREATKYLIIPTFVLRGTKLSPNQLSEGTFKTLAVIFYLITDQSRFLLLEEPEVCVHHGLLASTLQLIKDFSNEKQIIISTHSDFILDGLAPENVFLVKMDMAKGTVIKHIPKSMSVREYKALKDYLESDGNLGEYWRHAGFEK